MIIKYKEINLRSKIKFKDIHESYGRAEFEFCPVFKYGKMTKLFIVARQQKRKDKGAWVIDLKKLGYNNTKEFQITSWTHKTDAPRIWKEYWCKIHKTICHAVYVPNNTNKIVFDYHFGEELSIRFEGD